MTRDLAENSPAPPDDPDNAPPPDLPLAGGAWLSIMALLDGLLLGPAPVPLGLRLLALALLSAWWWQGKRSPRWLSGAWLVATVAGQVAATYAWAEAGVGATALAGGTLAGFLLLPLAAPLLRDLTRAPSPITLPVPPPGNGVPLPVLRLAADSLNSRLHSMALELDGLTSGSVSPAQAIQLRLLRNEVAGMQSLVRQRLSGGESAAPSAPPQPRPLAPPPPPAAPRLAPAAPNGLSAMVVDDDPVGRTLTRLLLEQAGYWVEETDDAKMALEMALMEGPDVALVAARIGRHSGLALSWCIRRGGGPPVVLLRGRADRISERQRRRAGLAAILGKPVTPDTLAGTLGPLLADRAQAAAPELPATPSPVEPPPPDAIPVLDLRVLEEHLSILGADRVGQIIDSFGRNAPATLASVAEALAQRDVPAVGRAAHKLASGALTVGLPVLAGLAKAADTAAKGGNDAATLTAAEQLPAAFAAAQAALAGYRRDRLTAKGN
ncbi:response regulator [Niveispirillum sp. KHB5.9]|uniref:response regulator n=1 Tax=Niveispirillum sp. KHB5.9 TaxID=3400269 RepID=UPI003A8882A4